MPPTKTFKDISRSARNSLSNFYRGQMFAKCIAIMWTTYWWSEGNECAKIFIFYFEPSPKISHKKLTIVLNMQSIQVQAVCFEFLEKTFLYIWKGLIYFYTRLVKRYIYFNVLHSKELYLRESRRMGEVQEAPVMWRWVTYKQRSEKWYTWLFIYLFIYTSVEFRDHSLSAT